MLSSELEVQNLLQENARLRAALYRMRRTVYVLLTVTVCAVVIAAVLIVSIQATP